MIFNFTNQSKTAYLINSRLFLSTKRSDVNNEPLNSKNSYYKILLIQNKRKIRGKKKITKGNLIF